MVSPTPIADGGAVTDGDAVIGRMDVALIWFTACEVVVGPIGTISAPPSRHPVATPASRRSRCVIRVRMGSV
jgi:hypothetical protein